MKEADWAERQTVKTSIIIPCYNEKNAICGTIESIQDVILQSGMKSTEIIAVNDGSTDGSEHILNSLASEQQGGCLLVVHHKRNQGYGAALKTGIRRSQSDYICITDADGTYPNDRIPELILQISSKDLDMVVGARVGANVDYSTIRSIPKMVLVPWVSYLCGTDVPDMNSGLRVFRRDRSLDFLKLLPDGFSFTTTITICLLRNRYAVEFTPISYAKRIGKSHFKPIRDTLRFIQLILRTGMYFAPMRLLSPLIVALTALFTVSCVYDLTALNNLTDKTVLLGFSSLNVFLFALLADMIDKRSR